MVADILDHLLHRAHMVHIVHLNVYLVVSFHLGTAGATVHHDAAAAHTGIFAQFFILFLQPLHIGNIHDDALGAAFGVVSLHHAHNNQFVFPHFGVALVIVLVNHLHGERLFRDIKKRLLDDVSVFICFLPAVTVRIAVTFFRILELIGCVLAHQHGNLVASQRLACQITAADKLDPHRLDRIYIHAHSVVHIHGIAVFFARHHVRVHALKIVQRRGRHNIFHFLELCDHFIIQRRRIRIFRIAEHLNLRQIAPSRQHLVRAPVGGDAEGDHYDNGAGSHDNTDHGECCTAFAAAKVIRAELQQIRYLHRHPP